MTKQITNDQYYLLRKEQNEELKKNLSSRQYLLTIDQVGDNTMSRGNPDRMVETKTFIRLVSLVDIPQYISRMESPFWVHPDIDNDSSTRKCNKIPFLEKKWGRYLNVQIDNQCPNTPVMKVEN